MASSRWIIGAFIVCSTVVPITCGVILVAKKREFNERVTGSKLAHVLKVGQSSGDVVRILDKTFQLRGLVVQPLEGRRTSQYHWCVRIVRPKLDLIAFDSYSITLYFDERKKLTHGIEMSSRLFDERHRRIEFPK